MDYKARLTLDTSQHDDAIKKSAKQVNDYDAKVKQTGTDVRKFVAEERKAARERAEYNKQIQSMTSSLGEFSNGLTSGIGVIGRFSGALAIGATAAQVLSDAFMSSETNIDAWESAMYQAKSAYEVFVNTINTGNWGNFFTNLRNAIKGSKELAEVLDNEGSIRVNNQVREQLLRNRISDLRRRKDNGEKVDKELKAAISEYESVASEKINAGFNSAIQSGITVLINRGVEDFEGIGDEVEKYFKGGEKLRKEYVDEAKKLRDKAGTITTYHPQINTFGYRVDNPPTLETNYGNLSEEESRRLRLLEAIIDKEGEMGEALTKYSDTLQESTALNNEIRGYERAGRKVIIDNNNATDKLTDEEKELKSAMERFEKSIKSAQMRMSALKVWSGITNMSEIDVLEESIRINSEEINSYRVKLEKLKEIQGETAELSDEENKQLKQLIETQKGYRRKLSKLKVEEEERRTNADKSYLNRGVQSVDDVIKKSWDKYLNQLNGTELFDISKNRVTGEIKIKNTQGRTDSELIENYFNEIYEYIKNIDNSRKEVKSRLESITEEPFEIKQPEFIDKYQEILKTFNEFLDEYEKTNGAIIDDQQLYKFVYEYLDKYVTNTTNLIDATFHNAIVKTFRKKGELKNTPDSELLYNMVDNLLGNTVLLESFKGGTFEDFIKRVEKGFKLLTDSLKLELDGDKEAQDFITSFTNGLQNIQVGKIIEEQLKEQFRDAINKSINEQLKEINWKKYDLTKEQVSVWQNGSNAIRSFAGAWESMQDTLNDEDASGLDKFFAIQDVINSTIDSVFSLIDGYKQLQEIQKTFSTITKQQNALTEEAIALKATETTTNELEAASAGKAAIAEGTKKAVSTSKHWIEAIAAISAVVAAITAALAISGSFSQGGIVPKFADGGIFSGNRSVGDYNIARVNSGELILNGTQQAKLFHLLDGTGGYANNQPSGEVTFRIEGNTLVGVLNNYNKRKSKIV